MIKDFFFFCKKWLRIFKVIFCFFQDKKWIQQIQKRWVLSTIYISNVLIFKEWNNKKRKKENEYIIANGLRNGNKEQSIILWRQVLGFIKSYKRRHTRLSFTSSQHIHQTLWFSEFKLCFPNLSSSIFLLFFLGSIP